jgi:hypothetical protein
MMSKKEAIKPNFNQLEALQEPPSTCHQPDISDLKSQTNIPKNSKTESSPASVGSENCCSARNSDEIAAGNFQDKLNQLDAIFNSIIIPPNDPLLSVSRGYATLSSDLMDFSRNLVAKLGLNSETSSIPPSQNGLANPITKPNLKKFGEPDDNGDNKKKQGGQPGHKRYTRPLIDPNEADQVTYHDIEEENRSCSHCGMPLERVESLDKQFDHLDLPRLDLIKIVNICYGYRCPHCGKSHHNIPDDVVNMGLVSNAVLAFMCDLSINYHQSTRKCQSLLEYHFGTKFCPAYINDLLKRVAFILRPLALEVREAIALKTILNIDETQHRFKGDNLYTWVFVADDLVAFRIGTRSYYPLEVTLGPNFKGTIGTDCYNCYIKFVKENKDVKLQLCLAHVKREFTYCAKFLDHDVMEYGTRNIKFIDELFHVYHERRKIKDRNSQEWLSHTAELHEIKAKILKSAKDAPAACKKAVNLGKRFEDLGEHYFTFIDNPDIEPTNNISEREIRDCCVIDRKIKIGTTSLEGNLACETFWTFYKTAKRRNLDITKFLLSVLDAAKAGNPLPSLVNTGGFVDQKYILAAKLERKEMMAATAKAKAEAEAKKNGQQPAPNSPRKRNKSTKSRTKYPQERETKPPPDTGAYPPKETSQQQQLETLNEEEDKLSPVSQKELESQKTLLGELRRAFQANQEAKKHSTRGRQATSHSGLSQEPTTTTAIPPILKPNMRRLMAPVLVTEDQEPAPMGLSATL